MSSPLKLILQTTLNQQYEGVPLMHLFFPRSLQGLYQGYYEEGAGFIATLFFLGIILFEALVGKGRTRILGKVFFTLFFFLIIMEQRFTFRITTVPLNVFFLPLPRVPLLFWFALLIPLGAWIISQFRGRLQLAFRREVCLVFDVVLSGLTILLFLPAVTGEMFFYL